MEWFEIINNTAKLHESICSYLPNAFIFAILLGNNILFGYIFASECFTKSNNEETIDNDNSSSHI